MSRTMLVMAGAGLIVGVSVHFLIEDWRTALGIIVAASALDIFWDVVITAWEKRRGEID